MEELVAMKLKYHRLKPVVSGAVVEELVAIKLKHHQLKPVVWIYFKAFAALILPPVATLPFNESNGSTEARIFSRN